MTSLRVRQGTFALFCIFSLIILIFPFAKLSPAFAAESDWSGYGGYEESGSLDSSATASKDVISVSVKTGSRGGISVSVGQPSTDGGGSGASGQPGIQMRIPSISGLYAMN